MSYPKRKKLFFDGRQHPIDGNDRARIIVLADAAWRKGRITRAALDVIRALLYRFANLKDGRCFPSYERLAEAANCCARTVGRCIKTLEAAGLITWVNRLIRIRAGGSAWRIERTSNAYDFPLIKKVAGVLSKGQKGCETKTQDLSSVDPALMASLDRFKLAFEARKAREAPR